MAGKPVARVGDAGSHGGAITTGSSTILVNDKPMARVGDTYACPEHGPNPIVTGAPFIFGPDQLVAHVGSKTACGATITSGSPDTFVDELKATVVPSSNFGDTTKSDKIALYVDIKNEDDRFEEYLPCMVTVEPGLIQGKMLIGSKKALVGNFGPGVYTVTIEPTPPSGESLGPVPITQNKKFQHKITLFRDEEYISISITRRESIEHNIMMTFLVEPYVSGTPPTDEPLYEADIFSTFDSSEAYVSTYSTKYSLESDLVHAIKYMEETHGYYDIPLPNSMVKSILPMNVNIKYWEKLFLAKGITREHLFDRETNIREGCFLLHRMHVRATPKNILEVATLYNSSNAKYVLDYGYHVQRIHRDKLWMR